MTPEGEIFVVDIMNYRVQVFDLDGSFLRSFGQVGQSAGTFGRPSGIAVDAEGNIWVTDVMSGLIQKFNSRGEVVSAIGTINDEWSFTSPRGIYLDSSNLYVVNRLQNQVGVYAFQ